MAGAAILSALLLLSSAVLLPFSEAAFSRTLPKSDLGIKMKKEKLSHLHFFFHDIVSEGTPSAVRVAAAPTTNSSWTSFGAEVMMDDGPHRSSKLVGWAQGIYASASQSELMAHGILASEHTHMASFVC